MVGKEGEMKAILFTAGMVILYLCFHNGCSKPLIRTEPGWENRMPECSTVALCIIRGKSTWSDTACMKYLFGDEEPVKKFNCFLENTIKQSIFRNISCRRIEVVEEPQVEEKEFLQIRDKKYHEFSVPPEEFLAELHKRGIDFLFIVDDYTVSISEKYYRKESHEVQNSLTVKEKIESPERPEPVMKVSSRMKHTMKFLLLHCQTGEKVQFGVIEASENHVTKNRKKWEEVIGELGDIAFKNSPLSAAGNKTGR
jgi:hypothetical protein